MKLADTAKALGYANMHKGCRKILQVESTGWSSEDVQQKLVSLYKITEREYHFAIDADIENARAELNKLLSRYPLKRMYLQESSWKGRRPLVPPEITTEEDALKWGIDFVKKNPSIYCKSLFITSKTYYSIGNNGNYVKCERDYNDFCQNQHIYNAKHAKLEFYDGTDR